jgi:hypothetical protein
LIFRNAVTIAAPTLGVLQVRANTAHIFLMIEPSSFVAAATVLEIVLNLRKFKFKRSRRRSLSSVSEAQRRVLSLMIHREFPRWTLQVPIDVDQPDPRQPRLFCRFAVKILIVGLGMARDSGKGDQRRAFWPFKEQFG